MHQKKDIKAKLFVSLLHLNGESKLNKKYSYTRN